MLSIVTIVPFSSAKAETTISEDEWTKRRAFIDENIRLAGSNNTIDEFFENNGFVKADNIVSITPKSVPGSLELRVNAWFDNYAKKYVVEGRWEWTNIALVDLDGGAYDGVSLAMSQTNFEAATDYIYTSNPGNIQVYDQYGTMYTNAGSTSSISKSGIAWAFQDGWQQWGTSYCGYKGVVWFYLDKQPSQLPLYIKMDYVHTWSSANLNSLGIKWTPGAPPEINMSFSTVPKQFNKTQQITLYSWPRLF